MDVVWETLEENVNKAAVDGVEKLGILKNI